MSYLSFLHESNKRAIVNIFLNMPKVDKTPELDGEADFLPPPSSFSSRNAAEVWFAQAEAQFAIRSVTVSKTKFYYAVASLPQNVAAQITDLIQAPPASNHYVLKF